MKIELPKPIIWQGDLDDDCSANWEGLLLRAEKMDDKDWWWAVSDRNGEGAEIKSSHDFEAHQFKSGKDARLNAEMAARRYIKSLGKE